MTSTTCWTRRRTAGEPRPPPIDTSALVRLLREPTVRHNWEGELLALITDRLDLASAAVEAVPAIDLSDEVPEPAFNPFGRQDARVRRITPKDAVLLAGEPEPLKIMIPVVIET